MSATLKSLVILPALGPPDLQTLEYHNCLGLSRCPPCHREVQSPDRVRFVEGEPVITANIAADSSDVANLKVGDVITSLNDEPIHKAD